MPSLAILIINFAPQNIAIGPPVNLTGAVIVAPTPDPLPANSTAFGGLQSNPGTTNLGVSYMPVVNAPTPVDLGIAVSIQGATLQSLTVDSSRPDRFTITADHVSIGTDFLVVVTVDVAP
jgi:hypothetical protein